LVEDEAEINASSAGLESGEMKSCARRSDEARARKSAKNTQRQRARKASTSGSRNMAETDSAQEAEETEEPGKCRNSTELFFFLFWLNINAFQSPLVQQQDPHDMSALQPWLKFNAMAYHKTEKLTYQILFYFSFCISSSFSASLLSRPSIHPVSPALFPLHFFLVRPFLRVAAPMRTMNDCRASRACVSMGGNQ
jgi:hypothetical protein